MRTLRSYLQRLPEAHRYILWFARVFMLFRRPSQFLSHYLRRTSPEVVEMRDGTRIGTSGHPHDVITLFVIFARRDYGRVGRGITVVDIGANLGAFTLFAATQGAARVIAYEPNSAAFHSLIKNIRDNHLGTRVQAHQLAVAGVAGEEVRFPVAPSMHNRIARQGESGDFESVRTTSLSEIIEKHAPDGIDLLKLDCEGAEYEILMTSSHLHRVREIRMEYHSGRGEELAEFLREARFEVTRFEPDGPISGNLWARRKP